MRTTIGATEAIDERLRLLKEDLQRCKSQQMPLKIMSGVTSGFNTLGRVIGGLLLGGAAVCLAAGANGLAFGCAIAGLFSLNAKPITEEPNLPDYSTQIQALQAEISELEQKRSALLLGAEERLDAEVETKTCPDCAEEVKEAARVCRFCGHRFDGQAASN